MTELNPTPAPKWLIPTAVAALLWNLMGCAAYIMNAMVTPEEIAALPLDQQHIYAIRPAWAVGATAIAVWLGALGSLLIALKMRWAMPVLAISLVGIVFQDAWLFVLSDAGASAGGVAYILQSLVLLIGIALLALSLRANSAGWSS